MVFLFDRGALFDAHSRFVSLMRLLFSDDGGHGPTYAFANALRPALEQKS